MKGTALCGKTLRIAAALNAHFQDDEGALYAADGDWVFDPTARRRWHPGDRSLSY